MRNKVAKRIRRELREAGKGQYHITDYRAAKKKHGVVPTVSDTVNQKLPNGK